jgi:hypothetical protein
MTRPMDRELAVDALRRALPYIRMYRGHTFVLKIGGALCVTSPTRSASWPSSVFGW